MNGHLQTLQDQVQLVADADTRAEVEAGMEKLLELRKSFYLAKGNDKREEASSLLHQQLLPDLRALVSKLDAADKRDPMQERCPGASNKQSENLFVYDNTSVGSLSSTEEDDFDNEEEKGEDSKSKSADASAKNDKPSTPKTQGKEQKEQQQQQQQQQRGSRNIEGSTRKRGANSRPSKSEKWWHSLGDIDPISMDSLAELPYPPFAITVRVKKPASEGGPMDVKQYFDGKMLAHYIVSTGNFSNPNTRQPLTRQTCQRLDQYLQENKLAAANVTDTFDMSKMLRAQQSQNAQGAADENMERRLAALRRHATVLMNSMFNFSSRDSQTQQQNLQAHMDAAASEDNGFYRGQRRTEAVVHRDGNLRVIDGDDWQVADASTMDDEAEFPELPAGSANATAATAYERPRAPAPAPVGVPRVTQPRAPTWPGRGPGGPQAVPTPGSFDTAAGSGPRPVATPGAWGASTASAGPSMASIVGSAPPRAPQPALGPRGGLSSLSAAGGNRPRLALSARSGEGGSASTPLQTLRASTGDRSVFGNALPREQVLASQGIDPRSREAELAGRGALSQSLEGYLCPYTPTFVAQARRVGMDLVGRIESELISFLRGPSTVRTKSLPVMRTDTRRFFHKLAQDYYGLQTTSVDPEPNRHIVIHKTPHAGEPEMTVIQAILHFGNLLAPGDNDYSDGPMPLSRQRSHASIGENSLALWGVSELAGGGRISTSAVTSAIESTVRRSAFHVRTLDGDNVLLEFSERAVARKTLAFLKSQRENVLGPISWRQVQWWPVPDDWASHQLRLQSVSNTAENRRRREERRLQTQAARMQHQARTATNTGWDSDDDAAPSRPSASARNQARPSATRHDVGGRSQPEGQATLWDQLADSDSE